MKKGGKRSNLKRVRSTLAKRLNFPVASPDDVYIWSVEAYSFSLFEAIELSKRLSGIASPTSQHFYASVLFTTICSRAMSIAMLLPKTPWSEPVVDHWDFRSIAILVRSLTEARLIFHYLCIEKCEELEWSCRWNIFNLHDCVTRRRIAAERIIGEEELKSYDLMAEELRTRLRGNNHFKSFSSKRQTALLKGKEPLLKSLEEIAESSGIEKNVWRRMNIILSNHVHSFPYSFYGMEYGQSGTGLHDHIEENSITIAIGYADIMLVGAKESMMALFQGLKRADKDGIL